MNVAKAFTSFRSKPKTEYVPVSLPSTHPAAMRRAPVMVSATATAANGNHNHLNGKNMENIAPPKKVIRATSDYLAQRPGELSFRKGDFFLVPANLDDDDNVVEEWYHASNPVSNLRGLVPARYFQVLGRNLKDSMAMSNQAPTSQNSQQPYPGESSAPSKKSSYAESVENSEQEFYALANQASKQQKQVFGVALYYFEAEREDELDVKTGDPIIIIAQSNAEWFVAKHIGKLGGPGLIPASYVEVRDIATNAPVQDINEMLRRNNITIPNVEEWKQSTVEYMSKQKSVGQPSAERRSNAHNARSRPANEPIRARDIQDAYVASYVCQDDKFWFQIQLDFIDGRTRVLYREYDDFYTYQLSLLRDFPQEAGQQDEKRTIPFMPGPLDFVNETITAQRRVDLDIYVQELFKLPPHIIESAQSQRFFGIRPGDSVNYDRLRESHYSGQTSSSGRSQHLPELSPSSTASTVTRTLTSSSRHGSKNSNAPFTPHYEDGPLPIIKKPSLHNVKHGSMPHEPRAAPRPDSQMPPGLPATMSMSTDATLKVKVMYRDEIVAMKVPPRISLQGLRERVCERLGFEVESMSYRTMSGVFLDLDDEVALADAKRNSAKIMLSVS